MKFQLLCNMGVVEHEGFKSMKFHMLCNMGVVEHEGLKSIKFHMLCSMGVVEHEGLIYMLGGHTDNQRHRNDFLSYNPVTRLWGDLAKMITPRSRLSVAVMDGFLYAVGGTNRNKEMLSTVERYSFEEVKSEYKLFNKFFV